jgi:hypothetical protein
LQTVDHLLLAKQLVKNNSIFKVKIYRRAFIFGCIEPDINFFTYFRGSIHYQLLRGHNIPNTTNYLEHQIKKFESKKLKTIFDYFNFGVLVHYLADSFTFPHNDSFKGSLSDHALYEEHLHYTFLKYINYKYYFFHYRDSLTFINNYHKKYLDKKPSYKSDCLHIIKSCQYLVSNICI